MEFSNNEKQIINTSQDIYDSFNQFIFSEDTKVLAKLIARSILFQQTVDVPGDIVECGVFKGSGILTWLKLKKILYPNSLKKVIGFDFFDTDKLLNSLSGFDHERMKELFAERNFFYNSSYDKILAEYIFKAGFNQGDFELIKGNISETAFDFVQKRPGVKISLLYIDLDIEKPCYDTLSALWNRVSRGGLVVFDEYGYHQWSESIGVDKFFEDKNVEIKILPYYSPTAYVRKH